MSKIKEKIIKSIKDPKWLDIILPLLNSKEFDKILENIKRDSSVITPSSPTLLFEAFNKCPYDKAKVVIVGMDPYPQKGVANGVAFCCKNSLKIEKSLKIINKSLSEQFPSYAPIENKDLTHIANQGVLFLNFAFTTVISKPGAHTQIWRNFTTSLINAISQDKLGLVYALMGKDAQSLKTVLDKDTVYMVSHPASALYKGYNWDNDNLFQKINYELELRNKPRIKWWEEKTK